VQRNVGSLLLLATQHFLMLPQNVDKTSHDEQPNGHQCYKITISFDLTALFRGRPEMLA
jgi:hypothetical protein